MVRVEVLGGRPSVFWCLERSQLHLEILSVERHLSEFFPWVVLIGADLAFGDDKLK